MSLCLRGNSKLLARISRAQIVLRRRGNGIYWGPTHGIYIYIHIRLT